MKRWLKRLLCPHRVWTDRVPDYPDHCPLNHTAYKCLKCGKIVTRLTPPTFYLEKK